MESNTPTQHNESGAAENVEAVPKVTAEHDAYRLHAILGYLIPILFFLPLLDEKTKNVPYVRFHANQQLVLLVVVVGLYMLHNILFMMLMSIGYLVAQIANLAVLALAIYGAYNAHLGNMKELPVIGKYRLLK